MELQDHLRKIITDVQKQQAQMQMLGKNLQNPRVSYLQGVVDTLNNVIEILDVTKERPE